MIKLLPIGAAALIAIAGCSSSDSSDTSASSTPSSTATASASPSDSTQMLPPVEVDGPTNLKVDVGAFLNVTTDDVSKVETDNPEVLKVSQPRDDGSAQFNAGAEVLSAGKADLVVYGEDGKKLYTVAVTASDPSSLAPSPDATE